jgi:hypothetical protein
VDLIVKSFFIDSSIKKKLGDQNEAGNQLIRIAGHFYAAPASADCDALTFR